MLILNNRYPPFDCPHCGAHVPKPHVRKQKTCGKYACAEKQKKATKKAKDERRKQIVEAK